MPRVAALCLFGLLLAAAPARGDDETRLMPSGFLPGDPPGVPSSRPGPACSGGVSLRLGFGQRRGSGTALQFGEAQIGAGIGLFGRLEVSSFLSGRYSDLGGQRLTSLDPLQVQAKVLLHRGGSGDLEGEEGGVALAAGARIPLGETAGDPRVGYRLALITDERLYFGLRVSFRAGAELRLADERRPIAALFDLGLGFSYEVWSRFELNVFASGTMRVSLTQLPGSLTNFPATGYAGVRMRAARDLYVEVGGCYDHTPIVDNGGPMGWCLFGSTIWTSGRSAALARAARKASRKGEEEAAWRVSPPPPANRHLLAAPAPAAKNCDLSQKGRDATVAVARANELYLGPALALRGMETLEEVVRGTLMGIGVTAMLVAATAWYQASMALTYKFLQWLGVISLSMVAADRFTVVSGAFSECIGTIAIACGDPAKIDLAARQYADAVALVTGAAAEALFFLAAAKGIDPVLKQLEGTNLSRTHGVNRLRNWLADGVRRIKGRPKTDGAAKTPAATPPVAAAARSAPPPVGEAPRLTPQNVEWVIAHLKKNGGLNHAQARRIRKAARTKNEKWNLPDTLRGRVSHALRGENLPHGFKVIDRVVWDAKGNPVEVTSFKSLQPYAKSYRKPGALYNKLKGDIDVLAKFDEGVRSGSRVEMKPSTRRVLEVEVPPDTMEPEVVGRPRGDPALREQMRAEAAEAIHYAQSQGVELCFKAVRR